MVLFRGGMRKRICARVGDRDAGAGSRARRSREGHGGETEAIERETKELERDAENARAREQLWVSAGAAGREAALVSVQTLVELQDERRAVRTDIEEETRALADLREERSTEQAGLEADQRRRAEARGLFVQLCEQFDGARQIFARFWAAAEATTRRLRAEVDGLLSRRTQLGHEIERDQAQAKKAAEAVNSLEAKVRTSRAAADRAVEADRLRIEHSRAAADKTIAAHRAETSKAETARAAAEAAAKSAGAARDRDQLAAREAATLLEEKQNALADDRAAGGLAWGFVSTERGREVKRELDEERRLRTKADEARDAALRKAGEAVAKVTARKTELAALRGHPARPLALPVGRLRLAGDRVTRRRPPLARRAPRRPGRDRADAREDRPARGHRRAPRDGRRPLPRLALAHLPRPPAGRVPPAPAGCGSGATPTARGSSPGARPRTWRRCAGSRRSCARSRSGSGAEVGCGETAPHLAAPSRAAGASLPPCGLHAPGFGRPDPPLPTSRLPVCAQRETRPRFPGPPLRAVRRRGTLIRSRVRHRCTIAPRGEKP